MKEDASKILLTGSESIIFSRLGLRIPFIHDIISLTFC